MIVINNELKKIIGVIILYSMISYSFTNDEFYKENNLVTYEKSLSSNQIIENEIQVRKRILNK